MEPSTALNIHTIIETSEIVFDAPGILNSAALYAEPVPSVAVLRLLHANQIEKLECWRHKKPEQSKSPFRSWRQARICKRDWDSARVRFGNEVGPDFSFDENDPGRLNHIKCAAHDRPEIERCVQDLEPSLSVLVRQSESRCGRRGQHTTQIRFERSQLLGQLEGNHDFAHAHCMQPCRSLLRQPRP